MAKYRAVIAEGAPDFVRSLNPISARVDKLFYHITSVLHPPFFGLSDLPTVLGCSPQGFVMNSKSCTPRQFESHDFASVLIKILVGNCPPGIVPPSNMILSNILPIIMCNILPPCTAQWSNSFFTEPRYNFIAVVGHFTHTVILPD